MASKPPTPPSPPVPPATTLAPLAKARTSPWVWVAVGCGGVLVVVLLAALAGGYLLARKAKDIVGDAGKNPAVAAVKLAIAFNPNLEVVESDEDGGVITIRNKRTGEVFTVDMAEAKQGHIVFRNEKGEEISITATGKEGKGAFKVESGKGTFRVGSGGGENVPDWVPVYPGAEVSGSMTTTGARSAEGSVSFDSRDDPAEVLSFYAGKLNGAGFEVSRRTQQHDGVTVGGVLTAEARAQDRSLTVVVGSTGGATHVVVTYKEKR
jgi:hypothetical protein